VTRYERIVRLQRWPDGSLWPFWMPGLLTGEALRAWVRNARAMIPPYEPASAPGAPGPGPGVAQGARGAQEPPSEFPGGNGC
jgi:hypothetical protein